MAKRYFNWKLAIVLIIGLVIVAATAYGLRQWRRTNRADNALETGNKAYEQKKWQEAAENLGRYISINSNDISALLKYGNSQLNIRPLKSNNIQQATGAYRNILRIETGNLEAAKKLTELYLGMGMPGEAELIAKRALEVNQDTELRMILASSYAGQRKFNEAASELEDIVKNHPDYVLAYEAIWQLARQRPDIFSQTPQDWLNLAVKNNPSSAMAYIIRANSYLMVQDFKNALADLAQAEKQDLTDTKVHLRLAIALINANALDKAEEHLRALQAVDPTDQSLWQVWAELAQKSGSQEKMLEIAENGLKELSSQPWDFMLTAAELFIRGNNPDRAAECILKLRQKDIALPALAYYEGLIAEQRNLHLEAIKCWSQAIELGNKDPRVRLTLALGLSRIGNNQTAMKELRTLISENPGFFEGYLSLARLSAQTADWSQVAESAKMALQLSPDNFDAALLLLQSNIEMLPTSAADQNPQLVKAIEDQLAKFEKTSSQAVGVNLLKLRLAMKQGNFSKAGNLIAELKNEDPNNVRIALSEVDLLFAQNKKDDAVSAANRIVGQFPDAAEPVIALASLLDQQDNREKCQAVINEALTRIKAPESQRQLSLMLVTFYMKWQQQEKVYDLLDKLEGQFPGDISIKRQLLGFDIKDKKLEKAQQRIDKIKALEGEKGWQWRYEQAKIWFGSDDFQSRQIQIISLLKENLLADQTDQMSRLLLAATYEKTQDSQLALSTYREALEMSPHDIRVIIPVISALYRAGEYDEADKVLSRAEAEKIDHPGLQEFQLQSYLREGQLDSASDLMDEVLIRDPNDQDVALSLAIVKMRQKKFAQADELLGKLKTKAPDSFSVIFAQIQSYILQGKAEDAVKLCNETVAKFNNVESYILRSRTFASLKQLDKAKQDLDHAAEIDPNNIAVWLAKSDFNASINELSEAVDGINRALVLAPDNLQIQRRAIAMFLMSGNQEIIQQGKNILNKALEVNPQDSELLIYRARLLIAEGTAPALAEASDILQKITENQPKSDTAYVLLANLLLSQGQSSKAMDAVLRGLANNPNNIQLLLLKANVEAGQSPVLAIPTLSSLHAIDPNNLEMTMRLANVYIAANENAKAVSLLRQQLDLCKDDLSRQRCNANLAVALFKDGKKEESEKILKSLSESDPNNSNVLLIQARLLTEDGRYDEIMAKTNDWSKLHPQDQSTLVAIAEGLVATPDKNKNALETAEKILRMVIAKSPDNTRAVQSLAILLQVANRDSEAADLNQQILNSDPNNIVAMNNLAWTLCEEQGEYQQAVELANKGLKIAPQYVDLIDTRGVAYYRLGEYNKAIEDLTTCVKLYPAGTPGQVSAFFHLSRAFAGSGNKSKAIEYLNNTLNMQKQFGGLSPGDLDEATRLLVTLSE